MSDSPFFGGADFLRGMLGDLVKMMPSGPGVQWQLAHQLAHQIAAADGGDANPDPMERIRFEELSAIAELHVAEVTGMPVSPAGGPVRLRPVSRADWARRVLGTWTGVLDRLALALGPSTPPPPDLADLSGADPGFDLGDDLDESDEMAALLGQWATAMFPAMTAWQIGSVAGHLSERAIGQYDVPLAPAPDNELYIVSANLAAVAEDWSLSLDDLRLWLCAHEIAYHTVLSRPALAGRIADLVVEHAERVRPDVATLGRLMQEADPTDLSSFANLLGDPSMLMPGGYDEALDRLRGELDALTAAVSGYVEHVTATIAGRLIGNTTPIGEAMRRRRVSRGRGETVAESLFGLRLDQAQIDRGEHFVAGVLERSGEQQLATMWNDASRLPTPAEVDAPGLWLARLELPSES